MQSLCLLQNAFVLIVSEIGVFAYNQRIYFPSRMRWKSQNPYSLQLFAIFCVLVLRWLSVDCESDCAEKVWKSLVFASKLLGIATKSPTEIKISVRLFDCVRKECSWTSCFFLFLCLKGAVFQPYRYFSERKFLQNSNLRFVIKLRGFAYILIIRVVRSYHALDKWLWL